MSTARSWVVLFLLAAASLPASAQDQNPDQASEGSRAALLAAEREKKATETEPPQRSKVERWLYRYDNSGVATPFIFAPWHGLHLAGANFPAGAGTKIGVGYTRDVGRARPAADRNRPNRIEFDAVGAYSTQGYSRGAAGLNLYRLGGALWTSASAGSTTSFPSRISSGLDRAASRTTGPATC
jgi:hypothetical protein